MLLGCIVQSLRALRLLSFKYHFPQLLLLLALSRDNNALLLEHLRQRPVLVHSHEDIATTNELLVNVKLGYRGPLRVLLDSCRTCQLAVLTPLLQASESAAEAVQTTYQPSSPGPQAR